MNKLNTFIDKYINILVFLSIIIISGIYLNLNIHSINFLRDNIQMLFILLTANAMMIGLFTLFSKEFNLTKMKKYYLFSNIILGGTLMLLIELSDILNLPLPYIFSFHFVKSILATNDSPFWLIGYIILTAFGLSFIHLYKTHIKNIRYNTQKQIIIYPIIVYLLLLPLVWMFTHFTYVSSNWFYMNTHTSTIKTLVEKNKFTNTQYLDFNSIQDMKKHYGNEQKFDEKERKVALDKIEDLNLRMQNENIKLLSYEKVSNFDEWMAFVLNQYYVGISNNVYYHYKIHTPTNYEDMPLKHLIMVVKITPNGYKSFIKYDDSFKKLNKNYIFNIFYISYNIIFALLYIVLYRTHQKHFKRVKDVE